MDGTVRRVWPPRLVEVREGAEWLPAQLEGWTFAPPAQRAQIRFVVARPGRGKPLGDLVWVDASMVRPRGDGSMSA